VPVIVLNSLFPVFSLLLLGRLLKKWRLTDDSFLKTADRLIYYFFFPVMLFWKIGGSSFDNGIDWLLCLGCLGAVVLMFVISCLAIRIFRVSAYKAGSFSQSCYRFNTYIGVAVVVNSLGNQGLTYFGIIISFIIPLVNFFAVSVLIWFSGEQLSKTERLGITLRSIFSNPLIIACLAGIAFSNSGGVFPQFIDNSFALISMVTLPLALISIGGGLSFRGVKEHLGLSFVAALLKLLLLPLIGYLLFSLLGVAELQTKVGLIFLCLPASTAIYVLSSQMNSDTELASSAIVVSTLLSFLSLSAALLL
jgi:predicted permease